MKCPACFNSLTQLQIGSLVVDVCQDGCGGVWFDAFEFQRVDEESESAGEALLHIRRDPKVVVDPARKRDCPRCAGMKLQRHFFSALRRVEIDECPNCAGYWLDAGELAQIRAERTENARRQEAKLSALSGDTIRYLYRLRSEQRKGRV
ncbi:MAG TPA: zf-TFIIB domain-containing protein [Verrucomicrobiae bacterium]|nr:zf-TFIIB domain-containing protein [Verrucomicrobiae bacterium]